MSGRGSGGRGRTQGRGRGGRGGRGNGRGRGNSHSSSAAAKTHKGQCAALGNHVFDYGQRGAADQTRTTWEKIVIYAGTIMAQDISNELQNRKTVVIPEPVHSQEILDRHQFTVIRKKAQSERIVKAKQAKCSALRKVIIKADAAKEEVESTDATMMLASLENEIEDETARAGRSIPIELDDTEKTKHDNAWRTYRERNTILTKHRGQAFSMIKGQCQQVLLDKMKHDPNFTTVSESFDPLSLFNLIEKIVLGQTEDQFPYATVYEQESTLYSTTQNTFTNTQWYEKFNTRIDVGTAIGVTRRHKVLLEYEASVSDSKTKYKDLPPAKQQEIMERAEERYISYVFLRQSGKQHHKLKTNLSDAFTTGEDGFPQNRQEVLHLLDKYSKATVLNTPTGSEGLAFAQKGGKTPGNSNSNKDYWKDKECYNCGKKGHPANKCPDSKKGSKNSKHGDDASRSSKSSKTSKAKSITKLHKEMKGVKKSFTTIQSKIEELEKEDDSDLTDSDDESGEDSHFQYGRDEHSHGFQMLQFEHQITGVVPEEGMMFQQTFEDRNQDVLFKQNHGKKVNLDLRNIILLDSQSTMDLFCNPQLVTKITKASTKMRLKSNGGTMNVHHKACIEGYKTDVWFSKDAITNIIALKNLKQQYRVTYDSRDSKFIVHRGTENKPDMEFKEHESGLHYFDPSDLDLIFVMTVSGNKKGFTKREIEGAERARALYINLVYPSKKDFRWMVKGNQIMDCPVTAHDVDVAKQIWGKNVHGLQGKSTREKPIHVAADFVKVPRELMRLHKDVTLTADIFFVSKVPFFLTLSRKICFTTVENLADRKVQTIFDAYKVVHELYLKRGFRITALHVDGEFAPLQALIHAMPGGPRVNLTSANEHVPEIERRTRVVKERTRSVRHSLPFNRIPRIMVIYMVYLVVKLLNHFPVKGGISDTISPKTIMSGETLHYKKDFSLQFGQYCQVREEDTPRNSMKARTQGAICLGASGNVQGGYKFMTTKTMKVITRRTWDAIPMSDTVIDRVNKLGHDQPELLVFTDRKGHLIGDVELTGVDRDEDEDQDEDPPNAFDDADVEHEDDLDIYEDEAQEPEPPPIEPTPQIKVETVYEADEEHDAPAPLPVEAEVLPVQEHTEAPAESPGVRRSTRVRTQTKPDYIPSMSSGTKYAFATTQLEYQGVLNPDAHMFFNDSVQDQMEPDVVAAIMTQLTLKAGLKEWKGRATDAAQNEMKQLHFRDTFKPMHWKELTHTQKATVLESHMFLKEKRDGTIKGRTVAGGNKQRDFISKEEASSPTVATEAVLLTCIVDAEEGRDVAVVDIPNAFIQTRIEDEQDMAIIRIRGILVDMLVDIAPDVYKQYVTTDRKGTKVLVVQCQNAIYGTMVASLLYYRKFCKSLTDVGFVFNPYDPCVANKMIKGKQMTIAFHVDDCKLSHKHPKQVDKLIRWLRREYESIFEDGSGKMSVSRGKVHKYLGMTLDYTVPGQVKISMFDYIEEIITAFEKAEPKGVGTKTSAAPDNLFKVDEDCKKLKPNKAKVFHNLVAKTLYTTKRARPDTCTAIAFLTTRVREPDTDDWTKLSHLMKYLRGTKELPLILSANGSGILKWWIDGSFAVHPNMRSHTGGGLSMGRGFPIVSSTKQRLNTRSSTEAEVVGVDDCMPAVLWTRYFMEAQGYGIQENIVFQDNQSAILLEKNGKASSTKRTKHINIRYYFVTDRINKKELTVEWCPTGDMIGDFMTKPNQGALFKKFRDQIMGVIPAQDPGPGPGPKKKKKKTDRNVKTRGSKTRGSK